MATKKGVPDSKTEVLWFRTGDPEKKGLILLGNLKLLVNFEPDEPVVPAWFGSAERIHQLITQLRGAGVKVETCALKTFLKRTNSTKINLRIPDKNTIYCYTVLRSMVNDIKRHADRIRILNDKLSEETLLERALTSWLSECSGIEFSHLERVWNASPVEVRRALGPTAKNMFKS